MDTDHECGHSRRSFLGYLGIAIATPMVIVPAPVVTTGLVTGHTPMADILAAQIEKIRPHLPEIFEHSLGRADALLRIMDVSNPQRDSIVPDWWTGK